MRKLTFIMLSACALLLVTSADTAAQKKAPMPDCGTWQLVSNVKTPKSVNVRFYNNDGVLMYEEQMEGRKLNPSRRKTVNHLNSTLVEAHQSWMKDQYASLTQKDLFSKRLKPKNGARFASVGH